MWWQPCYKIKHAVTLTNDTLLEILKYQKQGEGTRFLKETDAQLLQRVATTRKVS